MLSRLLLLSLTCSLAAVTTATTIAAAAVPALGSGQARRSTTSEQSATQTVALQASLQTATQAAAPTGNGKRSATQREVDQSVPDDPALATLIAPYSTKVQALDAVVGRIGVELKKDGIGGGSLGNFVTDAMRSEATRVTGETVLLAVTNSGGLRKNLVAVGDLRVRDIYEIMPFENALVRVELTGAQLLRFLKVIASKRDAQSGAEIIYRTLSDERIETVSVKLNNQEIKPDGTYTLVTIDYLVNRGGDYAVLEEAKNVRPLGVTLRDAIINYVRGESKSGRAIQIMPDNRFKSADAVSVQPVTRHRDDNNK